MIDIPHVESWKNEVIERFKIVTIALNVGIYLFDFTIYFSKTQKGLKTSRGIVGAKTIMDLKCSEPVEHCFTAKTYWEIEIMQTVNKIIDLKLNDSMVYLAISVEN